MLLTSHNTKVIPNNEELPGPKVNTAEVKTLVFSNQTFPSYYFITLATDTKNRQDNLACTGI